MNGIWNEVKDMLNKKDTEPEQRKLTDEEIDQVTGGYYVHSSEDRSPYLLDEIQRETG